MGHFGTVVVKISSSWQRLTALSALPLLSITHRGVLGFLLFLPIVKSFFPKYFKLFLFIFLKTFHFDMLLQVL